jgi:hypothetical protein
VKENKCWREIAGLVLHVLIGGLLIFTGVQKVLGSAPPEALVKYGLGERARLLGAGAVLTAALLLIPRTTSLGLLLTSSFWGGAICIHMAHDEPYFIQAALLVLSWVGAYLRYPAMPGSFSGPHGNDAGRDGRVAVGHAATDPGAERWPGLRYQEHGTGI